MAKLLIIEDDATLRAILAENLSRAGYAVETAENGLKALEKGSSQFFDLIISDIRMPGMDGVTTVTRLKENIPRVKIILITGYPGEEPVMRALNLGVDGILKKPFELNELLYMVSRKLEEKQMEEKRELQETSYRNLISKLKQYLSEDTMNEIAGDGFLLPANPPPSEQIKQCSWFTELGRMAEMRQEVDVAVQAYEQGLLSLSGLFSKEEVPVRLALSDLFKKRGEIELASLHADEALKLAEQIGNAEMSIIAHHHLAKVSIDADQEKSLHHLMAAKRQLDKKSDEKNLAISALLFGILWNAVGKPELAHKAMIDFLSYGKRHFLPQILISLQDVGLYPFLRILRDNPDLENGHWLLEEAGPFIQDGLHHILKMDPGLSEFVHPFIARLKDMNIPVLEVFGFGEPVMFLKGNRLLETDWKSLKGRSLFLYLLDSYPNLVTEDQLVDTFWSFLDVEKGRHTFRTTLYFIRRTLGAQLYKEIINTEKQKYGIRPEFTTACDFIRFRNFNREAKMNWNKTNFDKAALLLKEAEALYKGAFLQGLSEEWVVAARERYHREYIWTLMSLAAYHRMKKSWDNALFFAQKALEADPVLEEAHSFRMECLLEIGKRNEAVRQYHEYKEVLKKELKLSPSENMTELYLRAVDMTPAPASAF